MRLTPVRVVSAVVVVGLVAGAGVFGARALATRGDAEAQRTAAQAFARAWTAGTLDTVAFAGSDAKAVAADVATITAGLTKASKDLPASVTVDGLTTDGRGAVSARLKVQWDLGARRPWAYESTLPLRQVEGTWRPAFAASVIEPSLSTGSTLRTTRTAADRGDIVSTDGTVLVTERPVVDIGIEPRRSSDLAATVAAVGGLLDVDQGALLKRVRAASATSFVQVITLRDEAYEPLRDRLQVIPGTVFRSRTQSLAPTAGFARALIGTVGTATKEVVDASGGRVSSGDVSGLSGLQRTYDARLAGTPGIAVEAVSKAVATASPTPTPSATTGTSSSPGTGTKVLFSVDAVAGTNLAITLDRAAQEAAEAALGAAKTPAALVAIRVSTGEVIAVANGGPNAAGYNRALLGRYPPGSTFKVASGLSLLERGYTPDTPVACPATLTISGYTFSNAEDEVLGTGPFSRNFALSCNTAFVGSASKVTGAQLRSAAGSLGYGSADTLGVPAFTGSVPAADEPVAHAAAMIGQGTVLASPLTVAGASASVAAGKTLRLSLVKDPLDAAAGASPAGAAPGATAEASASASPSATAAGNEPLPGAAVTALRTMMRQVVTSGTGTALKDVPGGPVAGKTGTAEYGSATPPRTHAWFTGFQGDIAFAVVVEDGGFGAKAAAPIAATFLRDLA